MKPKPLFSFSLFIVTITLLIYVTSIGIKNFFRYNRFKSEYNTVLVNLNEEKSRQRLFNTELAQFSSNDYWELEIRQKLHYVQQGEEVYKFIKANH
jgi:hypothetical protein